MLFAIEVFMFFVGIISLVLGRYPLDWRGNRVLRGWRARLVGILLILIVPGIWASMAIFGWLFLILRHQVPTVDQLVAIGIIFELMIIVITMLLVNYIVRNAPQEEFSGRALTEKTKSLTEAAAILNLSESEVMRLIENKILLAKFVNNHYRIHDTVLQAHLQQQSDQNRGMANETNPTIVALNEAIRLNPKEASNYLTRGKLYHQSGRKQLAVSDFERVLALQPAFTQAVTLREYIARYGTKIGADGESNVDLITDWYGTKQKAKRGSRSFGSPRRNFLIALAIIVPSTLIGAFVFGVLVLSLSNKNDQTTNSDYYAVAQQATVTPFTPQPTQTSTPDPLSAPADAKEAFTHLNFEVVAADYSKPLDKVIMVSTLPNTLHIYDPETNTDSTIPLAQPPNCVALSSDGKFAVVGHNKFVSYIDLAQKKVLNTFTSSINVNSVVLANNGWIYAAPVDTQVLYFVALERATGKETLDPVVPTRPRDVQRGVLKQDVDGKVMYLGDEAGFRNIVSYDITQPGYPSARPVSTSDYPGNSDTGNFWLSEDGKRIFKSSGRIFRMQIEANGTLPYNGLIHDNYGNDYQTTPYEWILHSLAAGLILGLPTKTNFTPQSQKAQLVFYTYVSLAQVGDINLPDFIIEHRFIQSHGRYVFANDAGTRYYVIIQADTTSGLLNDFGIWANAM